MASTRISPLHRKSMGGETGWGGGALAGGGGLLTAREAQRGLEHVGRK